MAKENTAKKPQKGMLFSRLSYPVAVTYDGQTSVVTPQAKIKIEDMSKLDRENLPKGIIIRNID